MVFSTEGLVLINVLHQAKGYHNEWSHCFIGDICERASVRVAMETCFGRVIENM